MYVIFCIFIPFLIFTWNNIDVNFIYTLRMVILGNHNRTVVTMLPLTLFVLIILFCHFRYCHVLICVKHICFTVLIRIYAYTT